ncbi:MAG: alpha/beta hydrolase [Phenylobacterium sp.]|uniref:alpha/beta fold hydrolase n=1 Tax=Phenylobacterium sp. TaxID=1871053 RepID=UPI001B6BC0D4|nr:alpha/beta hydrolase [Phenylobacterium sp.]MBP7649734.1 alpha/beta hydrolase [Phenylobacterium sp.]MBP7816600.1 alpha/beta hydrolase [Phenylobacterium sp.]MBP9229987.1 alpha/beta hydrolase [Phenylobacterium sp.]
MAAPIVMVHGAFCGGWAFEAFRTPFEAAGHAVLTPDLRGHGESGSVAGLSMTDYAKDIAALCASLPEPPILIGHSLGGLVCQLAAKRTPLKALVLLAPSPPWGVAGSSMEEAVTALGLMMGAAFAQSISPDRTLMRTYSLDRMPRPDRDAALARLRPESGRALWEALNWWLDPFMTTSVGTGGLGVPCLVMVGQRDVVHPPTTARQTAQRLGADYVELAGMSHWLLGETGWQEVATQAWDWLERVEARADSGAA